MHHAEPGAALTMSIGNALSLRPDGAEPGAALTINICNRSPLPPRRAELGTTVGFVSNDGINPTQHHAMPSTLLDGCPGPPHPGMAFSQVTRESVSPSQMLVRIDERVIHRFCG